MPRLHPVYAAVAPELVLFVDEHFAHGNLHDWAAFTATAAELCQAAGRGRIDEAIARNAFALHGGARAGAVTPLMTTLLTRAAVGSGPWRAVELLVDADDTGECISEFNARDDLDRGLVVCHLSPGAAAPGLDEDVLVALGKKPGGPAVDGLSSRAWEHAELWLRAERARPTRRPTPDEAHAGTSLIVALPSDDAADHEVQHARRLPPHHRGVVDAVIEQHAHR
jgi:hypothetical protein